MKIAVQFLSTLRLALKDIDPTGLDRTAKLTGSFDFIHIFSERGKELRKKITASKKHLNPAGMLWISWPKSGQHDTNLNLPEVIKIGYDSGLVESKTISINSSWSAIKIYTSNKRERSTGTATES